MKLKWILVIIAVEFLALLYVLHLLDLIDLKTFVTLGVVEIMAGVIGYYLGRWGKSKDEELENKNKKRKELEGYIHEHNKRLIDTVIKPWYEDKFVSVANEPFATEHLQVGYADIWKLRYDCKNLKDDISSEENAIKGYIKNKLSSDVPPFGFSRDFTVEDIELLIFKTIEDFSKKEGVPDNYRVHLPLFGFNISVNKNEKYLVEKLENFRKRIEMIIKDKALYEKFETTNKTRKLLSKKIDEFYQGLKQIEHDFEERHIELKSTCKDCKDWYDELKSLK